MDGFAKVIGNLTIWLILILMFSMGMFVDEIVLGARMLVGGWDGVRAVGKQTEEVICTAEGCR